MCLEVLRNKPAIRRILSLKRTAFDKDSAAQICKLKLHKHRLLPYFTEVVEANIEARSL
jgi:hypothetical protein